MSERQMAYISRRAVGVHDDEIVDEIVLPSIVRNRALGISGCLWFDEKRFFQVLEGDEGSVRSVYRKISIDDRHHDVTLLIDDPIAIRNFPRFSMQVIRQNGAKTAEAFDELTRHFVRADPANVAEELTRAAYNAVHALARSAPAPHHEERTDAGH